MFEDSASLPLSGQANEIDTISNAYGWPESTHNMNIDQFGSFNTFGLNNTNDNVIDPALTQSMMGSEHLRSPTVARHNDSGRSSVADAVRELADMNVRLFEHAATLPPRSGHGVVNQPAEELSRSGAPREGKLFAIDQTFTLTKNLIDILKRLYKHIDQSLAGPSTDTSVDPMLYSEISDKDSSPLAQLSEASLLHPRTQATPDCAHTPRLDQATVLLILSCYYRLMDIYESIFGHMQACAKHSTTPISDDGRTVTLPPLQVGSYASPMLEKTDMGAPPSLSAISMHMMVIFMLSSQLCDQLREVIGEGIGRTRGRGHEGWEAPTALSSVGDALHSSVGEMARSGLQMSFQDKAWDAMWERSGGLSDQMRRTRQVLMRFSIASI